MGLWVSPDVPVTSARLEERTPPNPWQVVNRDEWGGLSQGDSFGVNMHFIYDKKPAALEMKGNAEDKFFGYRIFHAGTIDDIHLLNHKFEWTFVQAIDLQNLSNNNHTLVTTVVTTITIPDVHNANQRWKPEKFLLTVQLLPDELQPDRRRLDVEGKSVASTAGTGEDVCLPCQKESEMFGDPHVLTWGGAWFDYQGECDLVMLYVPNFDPGLDLHIHVRTTIRYDYSYIENAAVRLGDDTLEVVSFGGYALNGIDNANLDSEGATLAIQFSIPIPMIGNMCLKLC